MQHAARHADAVRLHLVGQSGALEGVQSAGADGQVDRAAAQLATRTRVAATLVDTHVPAALAEEVRQERAAESGADDDG